MNMQHSQLRQSYSFSDFLYYTALAVVPFFTAFYAVFNRSTGWFVFYFLLCLLSATLLYRYYCTHCPYYTRDGRFTKCMFFPGMPKAFQRRPGPLGFLDKGIAFTAAAVAIIFPLYWLFQQPGLLIIFLLSFIVFWVTIRRNECSRCIFLDCPVNKAAEELKPDEDA
jgi:hypothetical protein